MNEPYHTTEAIREAMRARLISTEEKAILKAYALSVLYGHYTGNPAVKEFSINLFVDFVRDVLELRNVPYNTCGNLLEELERCFPYRAMALQDLFDTFAREGVCGVL